MTSDELNRKIAEILDPSPGSTKGSDISDVGLYRWISEPCCWVVRSLDTDWDAMGALIIAVTSRDDCLDFQCGMNVWGEPIGTGRFYASVEMGGEFDSFGDTLPRAVRDAVGRALGLGEVTG